MTKLARGFLSRLRRKRTLEHIDAARAKGLRYSDKQVAKILKDMLSDIESRLKVIDTVDEQAKKLVEDTLAKMVEWQKKLVVIANEKDKAKEKMMSAKLEREQLNRDLELAHRVQQGLLPSRPPELPGYDIFDFSEAARHVGGDFFGYVPLAGGRLAVVMADVSGKGIAAALLMAALSADVRYCLASDADLERAVAQINQSFLRGGWDDRFATLLVAVLDPASHTVTICNAGHLPVFLRDPDGTVRQVATDLGGLPLGMVEGHAFHSCTIDLPPGTSFLLCTDGVTEAMDHDGRCYGIDRLEQLLAGPAATAEGLGRRILADIDRHTAGVSGSDDICLVCVRRQP